MQVQPETKKKQDITILPFEIFSVNTTKLINSGL